MYSKTLFCVQRLCRIEIILDYTGVGLGRFHCNRIQILFREFSSKSQFGGGTLKSQFNSTNTTFLFLKNQILVSIFSTILTLYRRECNILIRYYHSMFLLSVNNPIIISDTGSSSVRIFDPQIELTHKISNSHSSMGVTVGNKGRLIVV